MRVRAKAAPPLSSTTPQATSLVDLYPTLLELGRASVPAGHDIDGDSTPAHAFQSPSQNQHQHQHWRAPSARLPSPLAPPPLRARPSAARPLRAS